MIKIFYGDDRLKAERMIKRQLGGDYEVVEGIALKDGDMASLFFGNTFFSDKRKILIKDMGENKECFEKITDYLNTNHDVILLEGKLDKRTATYKQLKAAKVEMVECKLMEKVDSRKVFDVFDYVWGGHADRAMKIIESIEKEQDAYMFVGLLISQAIKKYEARQGKKEELVLKILSELDMETKSSQLGAWELVKIAILRISQV